MTNTQLQPNAVDVASKVARDLFAHTSHALSVLALVTVAIFALAEVPWATPALAADAVGSGPSRIVLSGSWERLIGGQYYDTVQVPSSDRSVGNATLRRKIDVPQLNPNQRAILRFEGVAYLGKVSVNGKAVGEATWGRSEMEATSALVAGRNEISVQIEDSQVALGPNGAWEGYGGIIRDAYLDIHPDPYIENARLASKIDLTAKTAQLQVDVFVRSNISGKATVKATLSRDDDRSGTSQEVTLVPGQSTVPLKWTLSNPALWSPEAPQLYQLNVALSSGSGTDVFTTSTGIRELTIDGDKFFINGKRLVVKGVARHDMWKDQGFTLTTAQIDQDMHMIKAMGANFVRLSAYPNDRRNVEAAEREGLLVSEESGLCWIDFRNVPRDTVEQGMRNLESIVRRDWNSPSLFDVTFANESTPTVEVMQEARRRVKTQLPTLFISMTDISSPDGTPEAVKRLYDDAGFDFYSTHPYGFDYQLTMYRKHLANFSGKPVVFTEWGGRGIAQAPPFMHLAVKNLGRLIDEGKLAGLWFWSWQDVPEFTRDDVEMQDGFLLSGVVTEDRKVRLDGWGGLSELFQHSPRPAEKPNQQPQLVKFDWDAQRLESDYTPIALQKLADSSGQQNAWQQLQKDMAEYWNKNHFSEGHWEESGERFWTWNTEELQTGPVPFRTALVDGGTRPLVVVPGSSVKIDVNSTANYLHFLGNATIPDGYPTTGKIGDVVGAIEISYAKGASKTIPLRWGMELARANTITVASRINPVAVLAPKALEYVKDVQREVYQTLLFSVPVDPRPLSKIRIAMNPAATTVPISSNPNSTGSGYTMGTANLLVYGVTAERPRK
jgi:hypothetical protein